MSDMTRKDFVTLTFKLIGGAAATAALSACPSYSNGVLSWEKNDTPPPDAPGPDAPAGCSATDPLTNILNNHVHGKHALSIPRADLDDAMMPGNGTKTYTYHIMGMAGHDHTVTFTAAQLVAVRAGVVPGMGDAGLGLIEVESSTCAALNDCNGADPTHTHVCTAVC